MTQKKTYFLVSLMVLVLSTACQHSRKSFESPPGYNLNKPEKIFMPDILSEISGLAFKNGNPDTFYAIQDEEGRLFYSSPGKKRPGRVEFAKNGDYEDVAVTTSYAIVLRSDGTLYTIPLNEIYNKESASVKKISDLLPPGEFEGITVGNNPQEVVVLCKDCKNDKDGKSISAYRLQLSADGALSAAGSFQVNVQDIKAVSGIEKMAFHPSGIARNPLTGEWFILSAVNRLLIIAQPDWKIKSVYKLNPSLFRQSEGIAFDKAGNMYISNEGGELDSGNILKYSFKKNN